MCPHRIISRLLPLFLQCNIILVLLIWCGLSVCIHVHVCMSYQQWNVFYRSPREASSAYFVYWCVCFSGIKYDHYSWFFMRETKACEISHIYGGNGHDNAFHSIKWVFFVCVWRDTLLLLHGSLFSWQLWDGEWIWVYGGVIVMLQVSFEMFMNGMVWYLLGVWFKEFEIVGVKAWN